MSNTTASLQEPLTARVDTTAALAIELFDEKGDLKMSNRPKYNYREDTILAEIQSYIDSTYGQHYVGDGEIQTVDFWESLGSLETTSRDTAIKYLARFGKKDGRNKKDLLKAVHYIILMLYAYEKDFETMDDRK